MAALGMCANERLLCLKTGRGAHVYGLDVAVVAEFLDRASKLDDSAVHKRRQLRTPASQAQNFSQHSTLL